MDEAVRQLPASGRLVFVCGLHRSGTSLLHRCIGDHPETSTFRDTGVMEDEGQLLQSVYPPASEHGGPGRFGFDPASWLTEDSPLATPAHARALLEDWVPHWDVSRARLVEKSPPNLVRMRFLQALFPDAYFVVLLRHPIPVGLATQKWSGTRLHDLVAHWLVCHERFRDDSQHIDRLLVLTYEDFVTDPEATMRRVFDFIELPGRPLSREIDPTVNDRYLARYLAMVRGGPKQRAHTAYLRLRYEARVRAFGYSLRPSVIAEGMGVPWR